MAIDFETVIFVIVSGAAVIGALGLSLIHI